MLEFFLACAQTFFGVAARHALQQRLVKSIRFGTRIKALDSTARFRRRPIYGVDTTVINSSPYKIDITDVRDASGNGIIFFGYKWETSRGSFAIIYPTVDETVKYEGSIRFDQLQESGDTFVIRFATERSEDVAYIEIRYTILDERQTPRRQLLRLPLAGNLCP